MTNYSLDTNVLVSHLRDDRFARETDRFLRRATEKKTRLVISDVVYAELYTGIYLSDDPKSEEVRVQSFVAVNNIEVKTPKSLRIARRAGELYSRHLSGRGSEIQRILPDFLIAAQAEATSDALITWNVLDYKNLGLGVPVHSPDSA